MTTNTEQRLADAFDALAGPPPELDDAWAAITARMSTMDPTPRRRCAPIVVAAGLGAAAAAVIAVLAVVGDDPSTLTVVPTVTPTTVDASVDGALIDGASSFTEELPPIPEHPLVMTRGNALEVWDADTLQFVGRLTSAGHGRPEVAGGFQITEVSLGGDVVAFTEEEPSSGNRSVWILDLRTGLRRQVTPSGSHPAVTTDGTELAYVEGDGFDPWASIVRVRLADGVAEAPLGPGIPTSDLRLEWSPNGDQLLAEGAGTGQVWVIRWLPEDVLLEESMAVLMLEGEPRAASWIDDGHVLAETAAGDIDDPVAGVQIVDLGAAEPPTASAVGPGGLTAYLTGDRLVLPGPTNIADVRDFDW